MTAQDVSAPRAQAYDWSAIIKDLIGTAIVSLLIMVPMVAYKSVITQYSLVLVSRWTEVFAVLALILATRLALHLFVWNRAPSPVTAAAKPAGTAKATLPEKIGPWVFPVLVAFAVFLPLIFNFERRPIDLGIYILTYIMLAWGLNIVVGLAGLLDLGYVAFYAVGAYAYALLSTVYFPYWFGDGVVPWAFYITLPVAGLLAALWGVILGFPVLRLRGDYLAIVTLAFGEIIRLVLINWFSFTNGPQGITVPKATFFGLPFARGEGSFSDFFGIEFNRIHYFVFLYYVILALALLTYFVTNRLRRLPIGRAWEALREDEIACRSLGINTTNTKLTAFAIGAMFGGFAGCFFATRQGFVSPESFVFIESAIILAIVVLGGLGSQIGIVFAAIAIMGSFELFRELSVFENYLPEGTDPVHFRMLAVGLAMVLMMRFRPRGFVTRRQPTVFLKERKAVSGDLVKEGHG
ncbi:MAG: high-affinity branched-chain amino acid ABC transporter permease LivM [Aestuariivirga sp.]|uniref:high-affinity branched-chain amino acid ABC transporter permease LivM n=1 Tax=Aestuariivirga sp. TaxID=2650926 RepID=UPI0025BEEB72|nr:high-affinity branched-chain amino acid ABC transporter permease LivM [Aestuariivirga sp.]MCA3560624.1 high-affinity branched-chain amino acid ABC transporter permease LivM [Aestuariivirga sp.]